MKLIRLGLHAVLQPKQRRWKTCSTRLPRYAPPNCLADQCACLTNPHATEVRAPAPVHMRPGRCCRSISVWCVVNPGIICATRSCRLATGELAADDATEQSKRGCPHTCSMPRICLLTCRKAFPAHLKSHRSHDVVLLCIFCHQVAQKVGDLPCPHIHPNPQQQAAPATPFRHGCISGRGRDEAQDRCGV